MANVKISNFSEQDDVSLIEGFAGYQGTASKSNIRISGNKLKLWLQNNLDFATASGTTNYLAKFTSTGTLGDSLIRDDGTNVSINAVITPGHVVSIDGDSTIQYALFVDSQGSEYGFNSTANGVSATQRVGVNAQAIQSTTSNIGVKSLATGGALAIGGWFKGTGATDNYALKLEDGTEGVGKFLKSITADGRANWSALPITVTSLTLVNGPISTGCLLYTSPSPRDDT